MRLDCIFGRAAFAFVFVFSFFFFFFYKFIEKCISRGNVSASSSRALCAGPTTSLNVQIFHWNGTVSGSRALFTGPTNLFFH